MAKLKSQSQKYVELKEEDYLLLIENTIKVEALKDCRYRKDAHITRLWNISLNTSTSTCSSNPFQGDILDFFRWTIIHPTSKINAYQYQMIVYNNN